MAPKTAEVEEVLQSWERSKGIGKVEENVKEEKETERSYSCSFTVPRLVRKKSERCAAPLRGLLISITGTQQGRAWSCSMLRMQLGEAVPPCASAPSSQQTTQLEDKCYRGKTVIIEKTLLSSQPSLCLHAGPLISAKIQTGISPLEGVHSHDM